MLRALSKSFSSTWTPRERSWVARPKSKAARQTCHTQQNHFGFLWIVRRRWMNLQGVIYQFLPTSMCHPPRHVEKAAVIVGMWIITSAPGHAQSCARIHPRQWLHLGSKASVSLLPEDTKMNLSSRIDESSKQLQLQHWWVLESVCRTKVKFLLSWVSKRRMQNAKCRMQNINNQ